MPEACRRHDGVSPVKAIPVKQGKKNEITYCDCRYCEKQRKQQDFGPLWHWNVHSQSDKEQDDKEILDDTDFTEQLSAVRQVGDTGARDESAHAGADADVGGEPEQRLCRDIQVSTEEHDAETPPHPPYEQQFRRRGDPPEQDRQYVSRNTDHQCCENRNASQRADYRADLGVREIRLYGDDDNRPYILENEQPERNATGGGIQLERLLEKLDHQQRGRGGYHDTQVKRRESAAKGCGTEEEQEFRQPESSEHAERKLQQPGDNDYPAA